MMQCAVFERTEEAIEKGLNPREAFDQNLVKMIDGRNWIGPEMVEDFNNFVKNENPDYFYHYVKTVFRGLEETIDSLKERIKDKS